MKKPQLNFWQIWNMSFGFLGIQFGFALQNANVSRIFETLGAKIDAIPILWIAAPITGLIVQPIIGHMSDKTWGRLGRRRPYFLTGAILASIALFIMPNSPILWIAAECSDHGHVHKHFDGAVQGIRRRHASFGAKDVRICNAEFLHRYRRVVASALPYIMTNWFRVSNVASEGIIPASVKLFVLCRWNSFFHRRFVDGIQLPKNILREELKRFIVFFTNYESAKGVELTGQPHAALCFHWKTLGKQIRVRGPVEPSAEEADAYFATRAKDSQIGAWASAQSRPMEGALGVREGDREIRDEIRAGESSAPAALVGLSRERRWRSSSGATVRSACTTGWSIAATARTSPGARSACSHDGDHIPLARRVTEHAQLMQPRGAGRGRHRDVPGGTESGRLHPDRTRWR